MGIQTINEKWNFTKEQKEYINEYSRYVYKTWSLLPECPIKNNYRDDLISAGFEALCSAVRYWNEDRGQLGGFCIECIRRKMREKVRRILKTQHDILDIDMPLRGKEDGESNRKLSDTIPDTSERVEEIGIIKQQAHEIIQIIREVCNPFEIKVISMYYDDGMNYSEIGNALAYTRANISRTMKNARVKILKKYFKNDPKMLDKYGIDVV